MKKLFICICLSFLILPVYGQAFRGTTGLLHAPSGEMQKDATFMFGANYLDLVPLHWYSFGNEISHTYNYYVNVTLFSFFEVCYTCTLNYAQHGSNYFPPQSWGKYTNQDRMFNARILLWKEGWIKWWLPQMVVGFDDPVSHKRNGGGSIEFEQSTMWDNHFSRYYLSMTKHLDFEGIGYLGLHSSWVMNYGSGKDRFNRPTFGATFRLGLLPQTWWAKAVNGIEPIVEYDARTFNMGMRYNCLNERLHLMFELNEFKFFSAGLYFSVPLSDKAVFTVRDDRRIGYGESKPFQEEMKSIKNLLLRLKGN